MLGALVVVRSSTLLLASASPWPGVGGSLGDKVVDEVHCTWGCVEGGWYVGEELRSLSDLPCMVLDWVLAAARVLNATPGSETPSLHLPPFLPRQTLRQPPCQSITFIEDPSLAPSPPGSASRSTLLLSSNLLTSICR